jgi:hypothetical protein
MPDAGCRMPDAGCRMPDAGCRMPDAGCRKASFAQIWRNYCSLVVSYDFQEKMSMAISVIISHECAEITKYTEK